jgi:hypothetical protein
MIKKHPVLTTAFAGLLLVIATVLVWRISLNSANNTRLQAISARGEPVTLAQLDSFYKAVPEGSNAALLWLDGVAALTPELVDMTSQLTLNRGAPLTEDQLRAATEALKANTNALALFRRAASFPQSRYPVSFNQMVFPSMQYLSDIKSAAQILRIEATVATGTNNAQAAADAMRCSFAAGRSLATEPTVISQLVRYAIDAITVQTLQVALDRVSMGDRDLIALQTAISAADDPNAAALALIGERALFTAHLSDLEGYVAANAANANMAIPNSVTETFLGSLIGTTGFWQRDMRYGVDALSTNIGFARLPDPQRFFSVTNSEAIVERAKRGYYILSGLSLSSLSKVLSRDANHRARLRTALVALGVERYRLANGDRLPDDLTVLLPAYLKNIPVDPYDGRPLRYKRSEKGYVIYCIGEDQQDDHGKERASNAPRGTPEDVTFIVERQTQNPKK